MFESEDFDLDEDFLKDIGEKEQEYYSQKDEPETTRLTKRRKTESIQPDFLSDISFDDEPDFARITTRSAEPADEAVASQNSSNRRKSVSEIADSTVAPSRSGERKIAVVDEKDAQRGRSECDENMITSRRRLALEILRKGSPRERHETAKNDDSKGPSPLSSLNGGNPRVRDSSEQARRRTLLESFKKPAAVAARVFKSPQKTRLPARAKRPSVVPRVTTLVRKFPGPAGLLPDCPEPRLDDANFLERMSENVAMTSEPENENEISEYFSQNTERLFRSGAWRLMLDDLPSDLLRGHEIAAIKRTARNNARVALLAGVVQRIDHSLENPRLVLKDRTDQIEGTMHRDIPLAHPNVLEPGVVVLLRNVGILAFQASPSFPSLQFHVMIAPRNVAAVYSDRTRLVTSPWMDSVLGKCPDEQEETRLSRGNFSEHTEPRADETKSSRHSSTIAVEREKCAKIDSSDFESDNDETFASFDLNDPETSQFPASSSVDRNSVESRGSGDKEDGRGKTSPASTTMKMKTSDERSSSDAEDKAETIDPRPKKIASVRSRLAQFRSKDDPRPRDDAGTSEERRVLLKSVENSSRDEGDSKSTGFGDNLLDSDNDTEDELLSQLDVDSIVTSYDST